MASMADETYPQGAKAVDDHIGERISDLSRAVTGGFERSERAFERVERTFDKMVTKSEFDATISTVNLRIDATETRVDTGMAALASDMKAGFASIASTNSENKIRNRWIVGTCLALIATLSTIAFNLLQVVIK